MLGNLASVSRTFETFQDDAEGGWRRKLQIMRDLARTDARGEKDLELAEHWGEATKGVKDRDAAGEIRAWFNYLKKHVRYTPASRPFTQVLLRPAVLLRRGYGDCTAFSTAGAAGLGIGGYDSDFVLVSDRRDRIPSHVYLRVWYPARSYARCVPFDASTPKPLGWEIPSGRVTWSRIIPVFREWNDQPQQTDGTGRIRSQVGNLTIVGR